MEICGACLGIADDYGDNSGTMRCQLTEGHEGPHREEFQRDHGPVVVTWHGDERRTCFVCGKKAMDDIHGCWHCFRDMCHDCEAEEDYAFKGLDGKEYSTPVGVCPKEHKEECTRLAAEFDENEEKQEEPPIDEVGTVDDFNLEDMIIGGPDCPGCFGE